MDAPRPLLLNRRELAARDAEPRPDAAARTPSRPPTWTPSRAGSIEPQVIEPHRQPVELAAVDWTPPPMTPSWMPYSV